jgi:hypothetical protein
VRACSATHVWHHLAVCLVVAALLLLLAGCAHDSRRSADRLFAARIKSTFELSLPCSLLWCDSYLDGGSVGGVIVDARKDTLMWAWRGLAGMHIPAPPVPNSAPNYRPRLLAWKDSLLRSIPCPAFIGAKHYREPGARPLAVGSPQESLFIQLFGSAIGADTVFDYSLHKRQKGPMAAGVLRALRRQRSGLSAIPDSVIHFTSQD